MSATELQACLANPALTSAERAALRRAFAQAIAAEGGIDGYGTRVLPIGGGAS